MRKPDLLEWCHRVRERAATLFDKVETDMTLREERLRRVRNRLEHLKARHDGAIALLVRTSQQIRMAQRQVARYEKLAARPGGTPPAKTKVTATPPATVAVEAASAKPDDQLEIPGYLRRTAENPADAAAKAEIVATQAERKRSKGRGRIAAMKAKQVGDTRKMPLSGREAMQFLKS